MGKLTVGSLFAGIGGIDLGLEMTGGFETVWQVEKDEYATQVLEKHWPGVRRWGDVRTFPPKCADWQCDLITGGFPCQPFSTASAGRRVAIDLWPEMLRVVRDLHPPLVVAENVTKAVIERAADDLENAGYTAPYFPIGADEIGADHPRHRWWVCAYTDHEIQLPLPVNAEVACVQAIRDGVWGWARFAERCRVSDGISHRTHRLRCLGNAVVPQVAQFVGEMILAARK